MRSVLFGDKWEVCEARGHCIFCDENAKNIAAWRREGLKAVEEARAVSLPGRIRWVEPTCATSSRPVMRVSYDGWTKVLTPLMVRVPLDAQPDSRSFSGEVEGEEDLWWDTMELMDLKAKHDALALPREPAPTCKGCGSVMEVGWDDLAAIWVCPEGGK